MNGEKPHDGKQPVQAISGRLDHPGAGASPAALTDSAALAHALDQRTAELEECRRRFHSLIERAADGVVVTSPDGKVLYLNPAAEALFGRSVNELVGEEFGFPLVTGDSVEVDVVRRAGGTPVIAELRAADSEWNGAPARLISVRDITARREAEQRERRLLVEQAARRDAERAQRRSHFLAEASAILDSSLHVDATLSSLARLLVPHIAEWCAIELVEQSTVRRVAGVHADTERQRALEYAPVPLLRPIRSAGLRTPLLVEETDGSQLRELTGDAERAHAVAQLGTRSLMLLPLGRGEERLGVIVVGCDRRAFDRDDLALAEEIAARASRAIENARLYQAALAASQAKSDFLAVMSHELRTPLNAIIGYADMLLGGFAGQISEQQVRAVRRIDASARHLIQIIDEILMHAGLESGRSAPGPEHVTVGELTDPVVAIAEPLIVERDLEFRVSVTDRDSQVFTDAAKIRQVLLNLLSNAAKFTPTGEVALQVTHTGDELVMAVADTGVGIATDNLERIFEPFWQAEHPLTRHAGGTGLGLSVSRRLVEMLGGTLHVESAPGAGSTFTVRVPAHYGPGSSAARTFTASSSGE